jgi:glucuronate isomerase
MPRTFIGEDFLLGNVTARELYRRHAAPQPILDFHNHLPSAQIAQNHQFGDLHEMWLAGDHYKWRAMRANGVAEELCTGAADPVEKLRAWTDTVPFTLRNPLYHWSHLELLRCFGWELPIAPENADEIWRIANEQLGSLRVHDLLARFKIALLATTDDPADNLESHEAIRASGLKTKVVPTFRPDRAFAVDRPREFSTWLERLGGLVGLPLHTLDDLLHALKRRHDDFGRLGCRASDHGLEQLPCVLGTRSQAAEIFSACRRGRAATPQEHAQYCHVLLLEMARWDAEKGWVRQYHLGAFRSVNTRREEQVGPATGFDSIGDFRHIHAIGRHLDALERTGEMPRMILYNSNPADTYAFAALAASFPGEGIPGKVQFGPGWWFLDQKEGIEWQLNALSNLGLLRRFVGMTTDSRSFMSFSRHEYFRRILCNLLGRDAEAGELPLDLVLLGAMVEEISFKNARQFFGFDLHADFAA